MQDMPLHEFLATHGIKHEASGDTHEIVAVVVNERESDEQTVIEASEIVNNWSVTER